MKMPFEIPGVLLFVGWFQKSVNEDLFCFEQRSEYKKIEGS